MPAFAGYSLNIRFLCQQLQAVAGFGRLGYFGVAGPCLLLPASAGFWIRFFVLCCLVGSLAKVLRFGVSAVVGDSFDQVS